MFCGLQNLDIEGYMLHFEPSSHEQPFGLCKLSCIYSIKIRYGTKVCMSHSGSKVHVVVNSLSQVIFVFLLFLGMVMYVYEFETK